MKPSSGDSLVYEFGGFRLEPAKRSLLRPDGSQVSLMPKPFDTLLYLLSRAGEVVSRDEILATVWPDTIVEENNLTQCISVLRRVLGEKPGEQKFIVTVPGRGYKFVADVVRVDDNSSDVSVSTASTPLEMPPGSDWKMRSMWPLALVLAALAGSALTAYLLWPTEHVDADDFTRSIAVLPFKPVLPHNRDQALELGMTEALITELASSKGLSVKPLTAVRPFGALEQDAVEAGKRLGVDVVLESSLQSSDGRVRAIVRLIEVRTGKQTWSAQFDESVADIFALQNSISIRVANALRVELSQAGQRRYTENIEAYQLYLRGRFHTQRLALPELLRGLGFFEKAVEIDPDYALAYAGIADAYRALVLSAEYPPAENFRRSVAAAEKALQIDPNLAAAHASLGTTYFWYNRDWKASEAAFKKALDIDPDSALTRSFYAHMLSNTGRHEEAIQQAEIARRMDPNWSWLGGVEGLLLLQAGKNEEAVEQLQEMIKVEPNVWLVRLFLGKAYLKLFKYDLALQEFRKASELNGRQSIAPAYEILVLSKLGRSTEAKKKYDELLRLSTERHVPPYHLAIASYGLGEMDKALTLLERAFDESDQKMVFLRTDEAWAGLESNPRYLELLRKMNL